MVLLITFIIQGIFNLNYFYNGTHCKTIDYFRLNLKGYSKLTDEEILTKIKDNSSLCLNDPFNNASYANINTGNQDETNSNITVLINMVALIIF